MYGANILQNSDKIAAGFREVFIYEYYNYENEEKVRHNTNTYLTQNRLVRNKGIIDIGNTKKLTRLLTVTKVDKNLPIVFNYSPNDLREYEYIYFAMMYRGFKEIHFVDGYEVSELTKYITSRAKEDLTRKVVEGRLAKLEEGKSVFGKQPYGYQYKNGHEMLVPYEAFVVKYVFFRHNEGAGTRMIAQELKVRNFVNRKGGFINRDNIRDILDNVRIYQGYTQLNGVEYKGNHPPLLDEDCNPVGDMGNKLTRADLKLSRKTRHELNLIKLDKRYIR